MVHQYHQVLARIAFQRIIMVMIEIVLVAMMEVVAVEVTVTAIVIISIHPSEVLRLEVILVVHHHPIYLIRIT